MEQAIDKILDKTEGTVLSDLEDSYSKSLEKLDGFVPELEQAYDKIITEGRKEAEKIKKQIIGGADLGARNKQLVELEKSVDDVFAKALDQIRDTDRTKEDYTKLAKSLLSESVKVLGTGKVRIFTSQNDADVIRSLLSEFPEAELSGDAIPCMGGVVVESQDGAMKFDNTLDARIERLKPLIRKEIATMFGVG